MSAREKHQDEHRKQLEEAKDFCRAKGWEHDEALDEFVPSANVKVIRNPMGEGWVPWLSACGAIQTDAPFGHPLAALVVAHKILTDEPRGVAHP